AGSDEIIGLLYGSLPIVHHHNDNHQAVIPLDVAHNRGNGFLFNQFDADTLKNRKEDIRLKKNSDSGLGFNFTEKVYKI
ncbi:hypothetical protein, partial [Desulfobacter sp.]